MWSRNLNTVWDEFLGDRLFENAIDERRFPGAGNPRHRHEAAQRNLDRHILQVVEAGTVDGEPVFAKSPVLLRKRDLLDACEEFSGDRFRGVPKITHAAFSSDVPTLQPSDWADVHQVIGRFDGFFVMLDHQHCVATIPQFFEGADELLVVALVQANGGFIQDIKHPLESGSKL